MCNVYVRQVRQVALAVEVVGALADEVAAQGARFHRACTKLSLVLLGVTTDLMLNGFCRPDEKATEEGDTIEGVEGMGMGEGEGQKNVSDEIEDEEQLVGADREGAEKPPDDGSQQPREKNEKSVEMRQDFEGDLEDVDKEEKEGEEEEEEDGDDPEEVDREMGEVGSDEEQVLHLLTPALLPVPPACTFRRLPLACALRHGFPDLRLLYARFTPLRIMPL